jgi:hypothetical protein
MPAAPGLPAAGSGKPLCVAQQRWRGKAAIQGVIGNCLE